MSPRTGWAKHGALGGSLRNPWTELGWRQQVPWGAGPCAGRPHRNPWHTALLWPRVS